MKLSLIRMTQVADHTRLIIVEKKSILTNIEIESFTEDHT